MEDPTVTPSAAPPAAPAWRRFGDRAVRAKHAIAAVVVLLGLMAWQWYDSRHDFTAVQAELARRLAEADTSSKESRSIAEQTREAVREAQVKLGLLEAKLQESQNQQVALEALYQELSSGRDESALADIEQTLLIASQQLQLAGNVKAALIGLQSADHRLQRLDRPQLAALRKMIVRDIDRLKLAPYLDVVGIGARIDNLIAAVDSLPLAMELRPAAASVQGAATEEDKTGGWPRVLRELWREFKDLVRVENMERPDAPLLAPTQAYFLRENLKLRLLGARLSLLSRDAKSFKADLKAAGEWLVRYYDARDKAVAAAVASVRQIHDSEVSMELPDLSASVDAVRNYRLARDRAR